MVHGTVSEDNHHGCRCSDCRAAKRASSESARETRDTRVVPVQLHGTRNAYTNYGCRCAYCREAEHDRYVAQTTGRRRRSAEEIRKDVDERHAAAREAAEQQSRQRIEWHATWAVRRSAFEALVAPLDGRSRLVLALRFGIDRGMPRTLEEVREYVNVSRQRVRQIELNALARLRRAHPEEGDIEDRLRKLVAEPGAPLAQPGSSAPTTARTRKSNG
jgi:DNA-directed RNA polymerase specialized sigma subunit